jgi:hypothetical protein
MPPLRDAHEAEVRRGPDTDASGAVVEVTANLVRWTASDGCGWSEIAWSNLDSSSADDFIAAQISHFAQRHQDFVWRCYDYDEPRDLGQRLLRAGFALAGHSTLMVAEVAAISKTVNLPAGVRLLPVHDEAGVARLIEVHEAVFRADHSQLHRSILRQLEQAPSITSLVIAEAGRLAVSSARVEFLPQRSFASLWGGGTRAEWRRKGLYRSLIAYRAHLAASRGYQYLYVNASWDSRPILERLGFAPTSTLSTYAWTATPPGTTGP